MQTFQATVNGVVQFVGQNISKKDPSQVFPFFELLQVGDKGASLVRIEGNGVKTGEKFSGLVEVRETEWGVKVKRV